MGGKELHCVVPTNAYCFDLLKQRKMPLTLSQDYCEASAYKDPRKPLVPFWFKDLNVVFKCVQGANNDNIYFIDDSPTKNLLHDTLNGLHTLPFDRENPSSPH